MQRARTQSKLHAAVIGIVGERNERHPLHMASEQALTDGPDPPAIEWLATDRIAAWPAAALWRYSGFLIAPGSPYRNMQGALTAIRFARENRLPLLGTCGGSSAPDRGICSQRRWRAGCRACGNGSGCCASRRDTAALFAGRPDPSRPPGRWQQSSRYLWRDRSARAVLLQLWTQPRLPPAPLIDGLSVSGVGQDAEVRIVELSAHPFFVGTLYAPAGTA